MRDIVKKGIFTVTAILIIIQILLTITLVDVLEKRIFNIFVDNTTLKPIIYICLVLLIVFEVFVSIAIYTMQEKEVIYLDKNNDKIEFLA